MIMAQEPKRSQTNVPQTTATSPGTLAQRRGESYSMLPNSPEEFFRMNPFQLMRHFSDEMDRMWTGYGMGRERRGDDNSSWRPAIDIREHDGQLQVHAELPGVNEKDVKVAIDNDTLIIQGERKREEEKEERGWYRSERSYGSFYRAIPLPQGAEADKANASFNNGVLEITMPVPKGQQKVREIPISNVASSTQSAQQNTQSTQEKSSRAGGS
jgi:HSP20 family protein